MPQHEHHPDHFKIPSAYGELQIRPAEGQPCEVHDLNCHDAAEYIRRHLFAPKQGGTNLCRACLERVRDHIKAKVGK